MGLPRSTYYDAPSILADDTEFVSRIRALCDEFATYGYRLSARRYDTRGSWSTARRCGG